MPFAESLYTLALRALRPALPLLARGEGKLARGIRGRQGVLERMERWTAAGRDPDRPLVWFHAPSVGEGLQARAVIEALRAREPDVQIAYTWFSPSAEGFGRSVLADFADYLPFDLPAAVGGALDLLRPDLLAFSKTDVWPNLTREAERRGIPMVLLSATLPESSSRIGGAARRLLGPAHRRLTHVAAISPPDAERFGSLGVPAERLSVMGDARFDQVLRRTAASASSPWPDMLGSRDRLVLVAGSTWPPDEEALLSALRHVGERSPPLRLILVPHEPTEEHLRATEALLGRLGYSSQRLAKLETGPVAAEVVLVDRVGILGDLYAAGDLAYVGGGWGTAGLHSVLEPAAYAMPVVFGPRHANAREAGDLVRAGGAFSVDDPEELRDLLARLWSDAELRREAGEAARAYVESGRGAAERGAEIVQRLLRGGRAG
jgi:3-deoxy-D-manno-octulosonic-acid transferase